VETTIDPRLGAAEVGNHYLIRAMPANRKTKDRNGQGKSKERGGQIAAARRPDRRRQVRAHRDGANAKKKSIGRPIVGIGTAIMDLRERKEAEAELRQSELRYRTLFDLVPLAVYACDAKGIIQEYNRRAAELWGREPSRNGAGPRFCGSYKIYYPDGRFMPHEDCPMARALRGETLESKDLEIIVERPDGGRRSVIPAPEILKNDAGEIIGAINCLYDITEHQKNQQALADLVRQQEALYRFVERRSNAISLDEIYEAALDTILETLLCDRASVLLFDDRQVIRPVTLPRAHFIRGAADPADDYPPVGVEGWRATRIDNYRRGRANTLRQHVR